MSENGYMNSFIKDNRGTGNSYSSSGNVDDKEVQNVKNDISFNLNEIICIMNILSTALGIGAFTFPYILYEIGVINSLLIYIFVSMSIYYSLDLLRRFVVDSNLFSYSSITQTTLGNCWLKIYAIFTFIFYMSNIVNYINIIFNILKSMFGFLNNIFPKILYFILTFSLELLLCLFTADLNKIYILSIIAFIIFITILFFIIIKAIIFLSTEKDRFKYFNLISIQNSSTGWDNFLVIISKFIEFFYGFIYHSTFPTLLSSLENLDNKNTKKIHNTTFFTIFVVYFLYAIFGLFLINDDNKTYKQILVNVKDLEENTVLNCIFKCLFVILFMSIIPSRYLVIRDDYTSFIGQQNLTKKIEILIISICLLITNLIVFFSDFDNLISNIILLFGGFFGVFICFVLPVINYIAINGKTKIRSIFGYIVASIFVIIGFFSIFYNFQNKDEIGPNEH